MNQMDPRSNRTAYRQKPCRSPQVSLSRARCNSPLFSPLSASRVPISCWKSPLAWAGMTTCSPRGPCGGFNATDRTNVTEVSVAGAPVALITTHDESTFVFNAAKLSDLSHWVPLTMELHQTGEGDFCEPLVPGLKGWVGQDAVLQIVQNSTMGVLYQVRTLLCYARSWTLSC